MYSMIPGEGKPGMHFPGLLLRAVDPHGFSASENKVSEVNYRKGRLSSKYNY